MQYQKRNLIIFFVLGLIIFLPHSLCAQEDIHTILERHRKEMKTKLLERYQNKLPEHHLNEMKQRYGKIDSLRIAEEMKRMENRRMKMLDELKKEQRSRTTSKPARITAVNQQDSLALVALYNSTDGDNWENNTNWLTGPVSSWYGIRVESSRVYEISLERNNLSGVIPPDLGNLSNLEQLILYVNQLTGSIPAELGNLSNLEQLWLCNNQLSGSIPAELGNLSNLEWLWCGNNYLTGSIPAELGNLSNLNDLSLTDNQLSSSIPAELGNLLNLKWFFLYNNQLTGSIPPELGNLSKLTYLELDINQLTGSIPAELGNMSKLRTLILFSNNLTGPIPPELGNLSNLDYLVLDNNQLSGTIPAELGNLTELTLLGLSRNQFSGFIPTELSKLSDLSLLYLACNKLTGQIPSSLADLRYLSHSNLHWNGLHTDDNDLRTFLNDRTTENWESTQTIAPENILCRTVTDTSLTLTWTPITFTQGTGGYRVFYSSAPKGPFTEYGMTSDKTIDSLKVTGLFKRKTYYFKVQTQTNPHMNNQNTVVSEYSDIISSTNTRVSELEEEIIKTYALLQNYPNPFNPETIITYSLPKSSQVILTVYNLMGQPVRTLVNKKMPAGTHQVIWNAKNERGRTLPTGIYFYVIKSGSYTKMRKALLMK